MVRYIFNPEHDLCVADGREDYIPPASAVEFGEQCSWIGRFMGEQEGRDQGVAPQGGGGIQVEGIVPWGWNRVLRRRLLREGVSQGLLPDDEYLDFIRGNSRREVAVELHHRLGDEFSMERLPGQDAAGSRVKPDGGACIGGVLTPDYRIVAGTLQEIEKFLQERGKVVLKAPLSGSGKGIRFVTGELMDTDRGWCRRVLERQGTVIVEERLEVVQEFAMLFEYDEDVRFRGYSLFYASNGVYRGNLLASNDFIEGYLGQWIPVEVLERVRLRVKGFLKERLSGRREDGMREGGRGEDGRRGFVGIDQFVCRRVQTQELLYNPAVEINWRMTMGHIARNIYDYNKEKFGLGEGTHCFEPSNGIFPCRSSKTEEEIL